LADSRLDMVLGEVEKEQQEFGCGQHRSGLASVMRATDSGSILRSSARRP
jgi:hypothetical protein